MDVIGVDQDSSRKDEGHGIRSSQRLTQPIRTSIPGCRRWRAWAKGLKALRYASQNALGIGARFQNLEANIDCGGARACHLR